MRINKRLLIVVILFYKRDSLIVRFLVAFFLIIASILVGYLIEKAYNKCNDYIRSWKSLIAITFVFYLCIFGSMCYLDENAENEEVFFALSFIYRTI